MRLVFPGILDLLMLTGLVVSMIGSTFLAFARTNSRKRAIRYFVKKKYDGVRFGISYLKRNGVITEKDKSPNHDQSFEDLVEFIMDLNTRVEFRVPSNPEHPVKKLEFNQPIDSISVGSIDIVFAGEHRWGRKWENALSMSGLEDELELQEESQRRKSEDKYVRYSWEILAGGFLLQTSSVFIQNFVTI